jgi:8-oxo-dGTP diphosphatase
MKVTQVVAGILTRGDQVLICQRGAHDPQAFRWEFPGGKIEAGESAREALVRELREELTIEAVVGELFDTVLHSYRQDAAVNLQFFLIQSYTGTESNQVFAQFRWVRRAELENFDFLEADRVVIQKLLRSRS